MKKKSTSFTNDEIRKLSVRFKILSSPSRLKILRSISNNELCVNQIAETAKLHQANVSKQLKILSDNKIVTCRPCGLNRYYCVIDKTTLQICQFICNTKMRNNAIRKN